MVSHHLPKPGICTLFAAQAPGILAHDKTTHHNLHSQNASHLASGSYNDPFIELGIYIYIHIYIYIYIYIYIHIYIYIYICIYIYIHTYIYIYIHTYIHTYIYISRCTYIIYIPYTSIYHRITVCFYKHLVSQFGKHPNIYRNPFQEHLNEDYDIATCGIFQHQWAMEGLVWLNLLRLPWLFLIHLKLSGVMMFQMLLCRYYSGKITWKPNSIFWDMFISSGTWPTFPRFSSCQTASLELISQSKWIDTTGATFVIWLVVKPPLWKIWKSIGMTIPNNYMGK